ncbi:MAG TPA: DUF1801 domain-containing protein [Fibrobacteria bacterium]|jgi:uncharacterized protein YdhG (YjbR/CyaY superfamily)|nr:DUF1801 domain-containing protein [Fibrobacteria bacterium]
MMPKAESVDAYLAAQPAKARAALTKIRALVRKAAPDGEELISYGIPAIKVNGRLLVYFAGFKAHVGMFPPVRDAALLRELKGFAGPKGNLRFPLSEPMPYPLIRKVVQFQLDRFSAPKVPAAGKGKAARKKAMKKATKKTSR